MTYSPHRFARLWIEHLESRDTPSISIRFDYSLDTSGLFSNPEARVALERVGQAITANMSDSLSPITPSADNTWTTQVFDAATGSTKSIANPTVGQDEIVVYITGGQLGGPLGVASGGAYSARGTQAWLDAVRTRGQSGVDVGTDFAPWGGLIAFNSSTAWDFSDGAPSANQYDFDSVALHELMHVFGFGLDNPSYTRNVSGGFYRGAYATSVYGGLIPMQAGDAHPDHFATGTRYGGQEAVMNAAVAPGVQKRMTELEYATLRDVGWRIEAASPPPAPPAVVVPPASPPVLPPAVPSVPSNLKPFTPSLGRFAVSGDSGSRSGVTAYSGSQAVYQGGGLSTNGGTRVASGDVTGDGVDDYVLGAAPGSLPQVTVVNGATGTAVQSFMAYETTFTGGVNVAAGDVNGDGKAEVIVGADRGGGPRVRVLDGGNPNAVLADFWGIDDPNFRGGVNVAAGDIDGDGRAEVVAAAGFGGGPRVSVYDGKSFTGGRPTNLFNDFFAFEPTFGGGSYVAVGDLNGDGRGDLIAGAGAWGGPRVTAFSGRSLVKQVYTDKLADFFAGNPNTYNGVRVAAADVDGDGRADVITGPAPGTDGTVRIYAPSVLAVPGHPTPFLSLTRPEWVAAGAFVG